MIPSPLDATALAAAGRDPLGVLASTAEVLSGLTAVDVDRDRVREVAGQLARRHSEPPAWDTDLHFSASGAEGIERTIGWTMVLDALNFCFWGQGADPADRWRVTGSTGEVDGYVALAVALRDAARSGVPLWEPSWLAQVSLSEVAALLAPAPGSAPIPLLEARHAHLRELGSNLSVTSDTPWTDLLAGCGWSAPAIAAAVVARFSSFNDVARWAPPGGGDAVTIRFHKRAQILASDLAGALGEGVVGDRGQLTAFADYKVPQVLRHLGILRYTPHLAARIEQYERLAPGSREEVEIRAATIWGCELVRQALAETGLDVTAPDVDWLLWGMGQSLPGTVAPYHRTVTVFY